MKVLATVSAFVGIFGAMHAVPAATQLFKGKTVTVYIPVGPGGGYDGHGRMLADKIGRFLDGTPTVIATNMPGGGRSNGRPGGNGSQLNRPWGRSFLGILRSVSGSI